MQKGQGEPCTSFDTKALDGADEVHVLTPNNSITFDEYANGFFLPHVMKQLEIDKRRKVVCDAYLTSLIKQSKREKRGKEIRRKICEFV